jgi:hypothetical protein
VVRCNNCARGLNSTYVRVGTKGQASKIGYYCAPCDCYYSPNLEKLYTENSNLSRGQVLHYVKSNGESKEVDYRAIGNGRV